MGKKYSVKPHLRRMSNGTFTKVVGHSRSLRRGHVVMGDEFKPVTTTANYSNLLDVADGAPPSEWVPSRKKPNHGFIKKLFKKDHYESFNGNEGVSRRVRVNIGSDGEGTLDVTYERTSVSGEFYDDRQRSIPIGPGANLDGSSLSGDVAKGFKRGNSPPLDLNSINLAGCNARNVSFDGANLARSNFHSGNLSGADLSKCNLSGAVFRDANLSDSYLNKANLSGADLTGANINGARLTGTDLRGVNWKGVKMENVILSVNENTPDDNAIYDQINFHDAADQMGLSDSQIGFLISSKALEVRDNETLNLVIEDFDASKHHVVPWAVQNWVPLDKE